MSNKYKGSVFVGVAGIYIALCKKRRWPEYKTINFSYNSKIGYGSNSDKVVGSFYQYKVENGRLK